MGRRGSRSRRGTVEDDHNDVDNPNGDFSNGDQQPLKSTRSAKPATLNGGGEGKVKRKRKARRIGDGNPFIDAEVGVSPEVVKRKRKKRNVVEGSDTENQEDENESEESDDDDGYISSFIDDEDSDAIADNDLGNDDMMAVRRQNAYATQENVLDRYKLRPMSDEMKMMYTQGAFEQPNTQEMEEAKLSGFIVSDNEEILYDSGEGDSLDFGNGRRRNATSQESDEDEDSDEFVNQEVNEASNQRKDSSVSITEDIDNIGKKMRRNKRKRQRQQELQSSQSQSQSMDDEPLIDRLSALSSDVKPRRPGVKNRKMIMSQYTQVEPATAGPERNGIEPLIATVNNNGRFSVSTSASSLSTLGSNNRSRRPSNSIRAYTHDVHVNMDRHLQGEVIQEAPIEFDSVSIIDDSQESELNHLMDMYDGSKTKLVMEHGNVSSKDVTNVVRDCFDDEHDTSSMREWCLNTQLNNLLDAPPPTSVPRPSEKNGTSTKNNSHNTSISVDRSIVLTDTTNSLHNSIMDEVNEELKKLETLSPAASRRADISKSASQKSLSKTPKTITRTHSFSNKSSFYSSSLVVTDGKGSRLRASQQSRTNAVTTISSGSETTRRSLYESFLEMPTPNPNPMANTTLVKLDRLDGIITSTMKSQRPLLGARSINASNIVTSKNTAVPRGVSHEELDSLLMVAGNMGDFSFTPTPTSQHHSTSIPKVDQIMPNGIKSTLGKAVEIGEDSDEDFVDPDVVVLDSDDAVMLAAQFPSQFDVPENGPVAGGIRRSSGKENLAQPSSNATASDSCSTKQNSGTVNYKLTSQSVYSTTQDQFGSDLDERELIWVDQMANDLLDRASGCLPSQVSSERTLDRRN